VYVYKTRARELMRRVYYGRSAKWTLYVIRFDKSPFRDVGIKSRATQNEYINDDSTAATV